MTARPIPRPAGQPWWIGCRVRPEILNHAHRAGRLAGYWAPGQACGLADVLHRLAQGLPAGPETAVRRVAERMRAAAVAADRAGCAVLSAAETRGLAMQLAHAVDAAPVARVIGAGSRETGTGNRETGARSQEPGAGKQEPGNRNGEPRDE